MKLLNVSAQSKTDHLSRSWSRVGIAGFTFLCWRISGW